MVMAMVFLWLAELSLFDIRHKSVPVWLVLLGGALTVGIGIYGCLSGEHSISKCLAGMAPGAVLLLLALGTGKAGWADGIVLMLVGSILGLRQCIAAAMFSLILISALSALLLILHRADRGTRIPYVPFLAAGVVFCEMIGG